MPETPVNGRIAWRDAWRSTRHAGRGNCTGNPRERELAPAGDILFSSLRESGLLRAFAIGLLAISATVWGGTAVAGPALNRPKPA